MSNIIKEAKEEFSLIKSDFIQLTDEKTFMRECSFAVQLINNSPQLQKCDPISIKGAVLNVAQTGLTLNPTNPFGYLIPSWNNKTKKYECQFRASYQGLAKLITDTGSVNSIECQVVYEGDRIKFDMASKEKVKEHVPYWLNGKEKGKIIAVYSLATLPDGTIHSESAGIQDIYDTVRAKSEAWKTYEAKKMSTCVWIKDEVEMCRKAIIRRHTKYLPKSEKWEKLNKAIELDNDDYMLDIDSPTVSFINSLLRTSIISDEQKAGIEMEITSGELKQNEASEIIEMLKQNQPDPIDSGNNYSQTDIQKKLDKQGL